MKPAFSTASDAGQRSGNFSSGRSPTVAFVQSWNDGELKSPVRNTGIPCAISFFASTRSGLTAGTRTLRSTASTSAAVAPLLIMFGP